MHHLEYRRHAANSSTRGWLLSLALLGVALPRSAWAQQAESCNLDCPRGTTCEVIHPCIAIGCPEDNPDCAQCDGPGTPVCSPAACTTDSDCGDSMKCFDFGDGCSPDPLLVPGAGPGEAAGSGAPEPPACEPSVLRQCVLRWQLPCSADSDCGEGFRCEEGESCGVPPYDPSSGDPASSEVVCTPTGTFSCVVIETACDTEADCPSDFVCIDRASNGACSSSSDGQTVCEPTEHGRVCAPRPLYTPATGGELAVASSGEAPPSPAGDDAAGVQTAASDGGCSLGAASPASPLALLSTLGLGLAFGARRRRPRAH